MGLFRPNVGKLEGNRSIEGLAAALRHWDSRVRKEAAEALERLSVPLRTLPEAVTTVNAKPEAAGPLQGDAWDSAVEGLINLLKDQLPGVRRAAVKALSRTGGKRSVNALIDVLESDRDKAVRQETAKALGVIGDERAVEPLTRSLRDDSPLLREQVATALGKIGGPTAVGALKRALDDKACNVLWAAADGLHKLGWKPADRAEEIRYLIGRESWADVMTLEDPATVAQLVRVVDEMETTIMYRSGMHALAERDLQAAVQLIRSGSRLLDFRRGAAEALADMGFLGPLHEALSSELEEVRFQLAMALGTSRNRKVVGVLERRIEDGDLVVISGAYQLAVRLGNPATERLLIEALQQVGCWGPIGLERNGRDLWGEEGVAWHNVMAEDFLHCGNLPLEKAATEWAARHGFKIVRKTAYSGPRWGEGIGP